MENWTPTSLIRLLDYNEFDQILYSVAEGKVYGGSDPERKVKELKHDSDGFCPGSDFTFELDLSNRSLVMEIDHERIILDANLGDFQYSPFIRIANWNLDIPLEVTLL